MRIITHDLNSDNLCSLKLVIQSSFVSLISGLVGAGVVELLGMMGLKPSALLTSAAWSDRVGSCSIVWNVKWAVGDGGEASITLLKTLKIFT